MKFSDYYVLEEPFCNNLEKKTIWKDFDSSKCRFCGETEKSNFKKAAHIIPEFLGNRFLLSNFECDECNERFGIYEQSLSNFLGPIPTLNFIEGKKKKNDKISGRTRIPTFKNVIGDKIESGKSFEKIDQSEIPDRIKNNIPEDSQIINFGGASSAIAFDSEEKILRLNTIKNPYIPNHAFKALLKIGLSFIPKEKYSEYEFSNQLLDNRNIVLKEEMKFFNNIRNIRLYQFAHLNFFPFPQGFLYKRNLKKVDCFLPERIFLLAISCFAFQIPIIFSKTDQIELSKYLANSKEFIYSFLSFDDDSVINLEDIPERYRQSDSKILDWSSGKKIKNETLNLVIDDIDNKHPIKILLKT